MEQREDFFAPADSSSSSSSSSFESGGASGRRFTDEDAAVAVSAATAASMLRTGAEGADVDGDAAADDDALGTEGARVFLHQLTSSPLESDRLIPGKRRCSDGGL